MCAQQPGWRPWAYDLGKRDPNASNHPKAFVAAPDDTFLAAYALVPAEHRHAYEVVAGPCDLFLDLEREGEQWQHGSVLAEVVEEAACAVVSEMAALQRLQVRVDTITIDCDHAAKFSRHLVRLPCNPLRSSRHRGATACLPIGRSPSRRARRAGNVAATWWRGVLFLPSPRPHGVASGGGSRRCRCSTCRGCHIRE